MDITSLVFYVLAGVSVASAFMVVSARNPVYSVLFLILTFFNAYHCGFSQGFNVGEAVNMISVQSLPVIKSAIAYNQLNKKRKPPVLCYEWLIAGNKGDKDIDR